MRKKVGIIKRVFTLLLIFLLSINSFAAIVSDNDGSAFITKAEFDALKSSFQSQIDSYNQSIDSKIDGAIASYLAGIKLSSTVPVNCLYAKYAIDGYAGAKYPLVWSSRTEKATTTPYSTRAGYTEKFDMNQHFSIWISLPWKKDQTRTGETVVNLSDKTILMNESMPTKMDVYVKENNEITRVENLAPEFYLFHSLTSGTMEQNATAETKWTKLKSDNAYTWYNESYEASNTLWCGWPTRNAIILPNGTKANHGGDPQPPGWFRNVSYMDWPEETTDKVPVLQPFATHKVNCVIPNSSTLKNLGETGDVATSYIINAKDSAQYGWDRFGSWWQKRSNNHIKLNAQLAQINAGGFSVPLENPSDFIFKSFRTVDERNGKIKNGLILCDVDKDGLLTITCTPTETGEIYYWQAKTSTDTWGGIKPSEDLPTNDVLGYDKNVTKEKVEIRNLEVIKDNGPVWILYRPLGTTNEGELKDFEITLTVTD